MSHKAVVIDAQDYRQVLGQFPTGVVVVTAVTEDGQPVALTIGSFCSVSIDPPLVAFYPSKTSTSWPRMKVMGAFCVNVLSAAQESLCRQVASKGEDKFAGVKWRPAPSSGAPIIAGAVAWIDCDLDTEQSAGDHFLVLGAVRALAVESGGSPLVFFRGGYGRFSASSLAAGGSSLSKLLPVVDKIRGELERASAAVEAECRLMARVDDELIVLASAGFSTHTSRPTRVGRHLPYAAPIGSFIAAYGPPADLRSWLARGGLTGESDLDLWRESLAARCATGYAVGLGGEEFAALEVALEEGASHEQLRVALGAAAPGMAQSGEWDPDQLYEVRTINVPIFSESGEVLQMGMSDLDSQLSGAEIVSKAEVMKAAARRSTAILGGVVPQAPQ